MCLCLQNHGMETLMKIKSVSKTLTGSVGSSTATIHKIKIGNSLNHNSTGQEKCPDMPFST